MSIRIMELVWDGFPGSGSRLLAMLALADWSDNEGRCFPAMTTIAHKVRLSRSQAQRVVHSLIDDGFVDVIGNAFGGQPGDTRQYRIVFPKLTGCLSATGSADATGSTRAQDGPHECAETGRMGATQTVREPSVNRQKRGAPKGSRIANDWTLPEEWRQWATKELHWTESQCQEVAEVFHDHWIAQPASRGVKANWDATWRNWCRREKGYGQVKKPMCAESFSTKVYEEGFI